MIFLISQSKQMLWVLKKDSLNQKVLLSIQKHMLKLMGKKIFTILHSINLLSKPKFTQKQHLFLGLKHCHIKDKTDAGPLTVIGNLLALSETQTFCVFDCLTPRLSYLLTYLAFLKS